MIIKSTENNIDNILRHKEEGIAQNNLKHFKLQNTDQKVEKIEVLHENKENMLPSIKQNEKTENCPIKQLQNKLTPLSSIKTVNPFQEDTWKIKPENLKKDKKLLNFSLNDNTSLNSTKIVNSQKKLVKSCEKEIDVGLKHGDQESRRQKLNLFSNDPLVKQLDVLHRRHLHQKIYKKIRVVKDSKSFYDKRIYDRIFITKNNTK